MAATAATRTTCKIMPGIRYVLGATMAEAQDRYDVMLAEASDDGALASVQRLAGGLDMRQFPLDGPLPDLPPSNAAKARQKMMIDLARRENLSIRELGAPLHLQPRPPGLCRHPATAWPT